MLGVVEIHIHRDTDKRDNDDVQQILVAADLREPADFCVLIDDADGTGTLRRFPNHTVIGDELRRDIVHH